LEFGRFPIKLNVWGVEKIGDNPDPTGAVRCQAADGLFDRRQSGCSLVDVVVEMRNDFFYQSLIR
jgi:hypothetical protein